MKLAVALKIPVDSSASPGVYGVTVKSQLCFNKKKPDKDEESVQNNKNKKNEEKSNEENGTTIYKRREESVWKENSSVLVRKANDNLIK